MLEPVGPLEPAVYWRRRAATLVAFVAAIALLGWLATRLIGGADASSAAAASSSTQSSSKAGSGAGSAGSAGSGGSSESDGSAASSAEVSPGGAPAPSSPAAPAVTSAPAPAPAPAAPPLCDPSQIEVQAAIATDPMRVGDKPKLILSVISHAQTDCVRDLNAAAQELLIYGADGARLWSSNDCYPEQSNDVRTLTPGQKVDFAVVWSGKTSSPGCATPRHVLGAGSYLLEANQGGVVSQRVPLNIQP